LQFKKHI